MWKSMATFCFESELLPLGLFLSGMASEVSLYFFLSVPALNGKNYWAETLIYHKFADLFFFWFPFT